MTGKEEHEVEDEVDELLEQQDSQVVDQYLKNYKDTI
jgi:hypothetical protein